MFEGMRLLGHQNSLDLPFAVEKAPVQHFLNFRSKGLLFLKMGLKQDDNIEFKCSNIVREHGDTTV